MIVQPVRPTFVFEAKWEGANLHLKKRTPTLRDRICSWVYAFFSIVFFPIGFARFIGWVLAALAKKVILPSAWFYSHQIIRLQQNFFNAFFFGEINPFNQRYRDHFTPEKHQIQTPDGALLDSTFFRHRNHGPQTPTVLLFSSNSAFSQQVVYAWLIDKAIEKGVVCNFAVFDYRGVSNSEGEANEISHLLLDCDSAFQFLRDKIGVPPELISIYGWSLGGGLSAKLKEMRPELTGPYCNERSFASLSSVSRNKLPLLLKPFFFWIPWALEKIGWDLKTDPKKIRGPLLAVRHVGDQIIPRSASFVSAAQKAAVAFQKIDLRENILLQAQAKRRYIDHHFEPLASYYVDSSERMADEVVADFILPRAQVAAQVAEGVV